MTSSDSKIVVDSYQLCLIVFKTSRNFPKQYRPTLGRRLEDSAINLVLCSRSASMTSGKDRARRICFLEKASENLDEVRILTQLIQELKIIPILTYGEICEMTSNIGRQIGSFLKFSQA